jgi:hypothetical protein
MTKLYQIMAINTLHKMPKRKSLSYQQAAVIAVFSLFAFIFLNTVLLNTVQAGQAPSQQNQTQQIQENLNTSAFDAAINQTLAASTATTSQQAAELIPYQAEYQVSNGTLNATLKRQLKQSDEANQWKVENTASIFMLGFEESAEFHANNNRITPINYRYHNQLRTKRNSELTFNWKDEVVSDPNHFETPLPIYTGLWDKISFQEQLRLDTISDASFTSKAYDILDTDKVKVYNVEKLGEEVISTSAGNFNTIKFKQSRAGKEEYTLIWLAKDWQHFVLRIDRIEDNKINYQLLFDKGSLNDTDITGIKG